MLAEAMSDWDWVTWTGVTIGLIVGGFAKGATGLGLPLVAVPAMSPFVPVPVAVALMPASVLATNLVQTVAGRQTGEAIRQFWPLVLTIPPGTAAGVYVLATADPRVLAGLVGLFVITFAVWSQLNPDLRLPQRWAAPLNPITGFGSGMLGGISSAFGPPIQMYLVAIHTEKNLFVSAVGISHLVAGLSLCVFLYALAVTDLDGLLRSAAAVLPVLAGQFAGVALRERIGPGLFRRVVLVILLLSGLNLLRQAIGW